ncbi:uncharacterized protein F5147DRAFT_658995 [Suillus discolor]|uniref:Uncharacterized protein n=1 Tax=Suillus discolor TaxID=1912936 RepID=A0A9P7ETA3_9AGAM|nr:uncharacterized protein F5147DRAFT_658995 [Suillus discolor]KAG2087257.1 hypothetical protein F5147DRAFT_658995 [Suillus discolor]
MSEQDQNGMSDQDIPVQIPSPIVPVGWDNSTVYLYLLLIHKDYLSAMLPAIIPALMSPLGDSTAIAAYYNGRTLSAFGAVHSHRYASRKLLLIVHYNELVPSLLLPPISNQFLVGFMQAMNPPFRWVTRDAQCGPVFTRDMKHFPFNIVDKDNTCQSRGSVFTMFLLFSVVNDLLIAIVNKRSLGFPGTLCSFIDTIAGVLAPTLELQHCQHASH